MDVRAIPSTYQMYRPALLLYSMCRYLCWLVSRETIPSCSVRAKVRQREVMSQGVVPAGDAP